MASGSAMLAQEEAKKAHQLYAKSVKDAEPFLQIYFNDPFLKASPWNFEDWIKRGRPLEVVETETGQVLDVAQALADKLHGQKSHKLSEHPTYQRVRRGDLLGL